jgi:hypothetical protein
MGATGMLVEFSQVAPGLWKFIFNQCHHTCQGTTITAKQAFYDVLQGSIPL